MRRASLAVLLLLSLPALARGQATTLHVATRIIAPFVMQDEGKLSGFSIELWDKIASELGVKSDYQVTGNVTELIDKVKSKQADVGISAISITSEREKVVDFSQPMFNSGLQILVAGKGDDNQQPGPFKGLIKLLLNPAMLEWLGVALALIIIPAHIVFLLERSHPEGIVPQKSPYIPGIFHAMWWAAGTLATQADSMPRSNMARILAVIWMFTGVVFVAYFTAQVTASLTVQQLQGSIHGPDDLPGKRVATTAGSTSAQYLRENKADVVQVAKIEDAYSALNDQKIDAVVFDAPVLLYYSAHEGKGKVATVGTIFRKEDYGIAFPPGSPYSKKADLALLKLKENGEYQKLYDKWFGSSDQKP